MFNKVNRNMEQNDDSTIKENPLIKQSGCREQVELITHSFYRVF